MKRAHHIITCEFYVESFCGYKVPARANSCPRCGAKTPDRELPGLEAILRLIE